jgi:hypothetical protein
VPSLRSVRFLPLVFLIGIDGFAMFAPYVIGVLAVGYTVRTLRGRRPGAELASDAAEEPTLALPL